jgi:glycosyltransferase involved in cell wall biosynthesis
MNRRLVHEMARAGGGSWEIAAVAPDYFRGTQDLRPVHFEALVDEPLRVEVVPAHLSRYVHLFYYGRALKRILAEGWDLVHAWEEPYILAGAQIARWTPRDSVLVYRTAQSIEKRYPPPFNWLERYDMSRADGWICSGSLVAQTLGRRPMYRDRPMRLIPLGVDLETFKPNPECGRAMRQRLGWDDTGPPVVGYVGRFTEAKGVAWLTNVLDAVHTPWRALFVGAGPMESHLRRWAKRHGDRVRVCTEVRHDEVPAHLNAMDVLAAPSQTTGTWREQFGRMLIEAFASGVPVIGSDSGEIPFVVGDAGIICPERDAGAWTRGMERLLGDIELRRELAGRGLARAPQYAWSNIARQYLEFFTELLDTRRRRTTGAGDATGSSTGAIPAAAA